MYDKILVPLDGSKLAECVFPHIEKIAGDCGVKEVILFRVCEAPSILSDYPENTPTSWEEHVEELTSSSQQQCSLYLKDAEKRLKDSGLNNIRLEATLGDPATEIVEYASTNGIDLIIMASHGRSGPSRWAYGSIADKVFRSTCVPVLMVRAPGCATALA
ncbi:MAG: universal stress protein [Dehalococcoidales bacterium]|nr:universal stress protein [Dehalococcoidales bacterium]